MAEIVKEEAPKVVAKPTGGYEILKRNFYLNSKGVHIKVVNEFLVPADAEEKAICEDFVAMGYLKK